MDTLQLAYLTIASLFVLIIVDCIISFIIFRRVWRNHFDQHVNRIMLLSLGFVFLAQAISAAIGIAHQASHIAQPELVIHPSLLISYLILTFSHVVFTITLFLLANAESVVELKLPRIIKVRRR